MTKKDLQHLCNGVIEHYEEYPEYITDLFYINTENLDYVYINQRKYPKI